MNVYQLPSVLQARERLAGIRAKTNAGLGQAKTAGLVAAGAYGTARLSAHLGGPEGAKIAGLDLPLVVGGVCAVLAASGMADEYSDELLAIGIGAVSGLAAQKGFDAGVKSYKPKEAVAGYGAVGAYYPQHYLSPGYHQVGLSQVGAPLSDEDVVRQFAAAPSPEPQAA